MDDVHEIQFFLAGVDDDHLRRRRYRRPLKPFIEGLELVSCTSYGSIDRWCRQTFESKSLFSFSLAEHIQDSPRKEISVSISWISSGYQSAITHISSIFIIAVQILMYDMLLITKLTLLNYINDSCDRRRISVQTAFIVAIIHVRIEYATVSSAKHLHNNILYLQSNSFLASLFFEWTYDPIKWIAWVIITFFVLSS